MKVSFEENAAEEIISWAIMTQQQPGPLTFQLAKRLESGLRLVKDHSGIESLAIRDEGITDTERSIKDLIKHYLLSKRIAKFDECGPFELHDNIVSTQIIP